MTTFVVATDDMPEMRDACLILTQAKKVIGTPDIVLIADSTGQYVRVHYLRSTGSAFRSANPPTKELPLFGECVFFTSNDNNLVGDVFLRALFNRRKPQAGYRFRLVRLSATDDDSEQVVLETLDEKCSVC